MAKPIPVVAVLAGHYGGRYRKPGETFEVTDPKHISKRWMAPQGSDKAKAFEKALTKRGGDRDGITGERISSGGIAEQLAVSIEENRVLKGRVAELEAEVAELRDRAGPPDEVTSATPAGGDDAPDADAVDNDGTEEKEPRRRRRSAK